MKASSLYKTTMRTTRNNACTKDADNRHEALSAFGEYNANPNDRHDLGSAANRPTAWHENG